MLHIFKHILCLCGIILVSYGLGVIGVGNTQNTIGLVLFMSGIYLAVSTLQLHYVRILSLIAGLQKNSDGNQTYQTGLPTLQELRRKAKSPFRLFHKIAASAVVAMLIVSLVPPLNPFNDSINVFAVPPDPVVTVTPPDEVFLGDDFTFEVEFANGSIDETGFAPYIELIVPSNGADGAAGTDTPDGISFITAEYLGITIPTIELVFVDDGVNAAPIGCLDHPLAVDVNNDPIEICGTIGDTLVVAQLPFGSFTPNQPGVNVEITANYSVLADIDQPLPIEIRGGFALGTDEFSNPSTDPSIFPPTYSTMVVQPQILTLEKVSDTGEDERATGPNYLSSYTISSELAVGQLVENLVFTDNLPNNIVYQGVSSLPADCVVTSEPVQTVPTNNATLVVTCASVTGGAPISFSYDFYGADVDANGADVISHTTGGDTIASNSVSAVGDWTPIDPRDSVVTSLATDPETVDVTLKSITTQKSVAIANDTGAIGYTPGDTVEFTIVQNISDYFTIDNLVLNDTMSDGHRFDTSFTPIITFQTPDLNSAVPMNLANLIIEDHYTGSVAPIAPIDGTTDLTFNISDEAVSQGASSVIRGGCIPATGTGALPNPDCSSTNNGSSSVTITYRAIIQDEFSDDFPSGNANVDINDRLENDAAIIANVVSNTDLSQTTTETLQDTTATSYIIVEGEFDKAIYAVNGVLGIPNELLPGDEVTYRLQYSIPSTDHEDLVITDYLPLPVFEVTAVSTVFNTTIGGIPAPGESRFGPNETTFGISGQAPAIVTDTTSNSVSYVFTDFNDINNQSSVIDILYTGVVNDKAMADGLFLTNMASLTHGSTNNSTVTNQQIENITLRQPQLSLTKGIVDTTSNNQIFDPVITGPAGVTFDSATTSTACGHFTGQVDSVNLMAEPISSNVTNVDGNDTIRYVVVVENIGGAAAYDVSLRDLLPVGGVGSNLCVSDGTGSIIPFTAVDGTDTNPFFENGIVLDDGVNGSLTLLENDTTDNSATGTNLAVISYDVKLPADLDLDVDFENSIELLGLANTDNGTNIAPENTVEIAATPGEPSIAKNQLTTSTPATPNDTANPGSLVTYELVIDVPEGLLSDVEVVDTLSAGLSLVSIDSITASNTNITSTNALATTSIGVGGGSFTLDFGDITNINDDNNLTDTITVSYTAVVLDTTDRGDALDNEVGMTWGTAGTQTASSDPITVIEPTLEVSKEIAPSTGDASDIYTVTIEVTHTAASNASAFDLLIQDILPVGMTFNGSLTDTGDGTPTLLENSGTITADFAQLDVGQTGSLTFEVILDGTVVPNEVIENEVTLGYSSILGDISIPQSPNNPDSTEKTYSDDDQDDVTVSNAAITKTIVDTDINNQDYTIPALEGTTGNNVTIGEHLQYQVVIDVPEGTTPDAIFEDTMDNGLVLVSIDSVIASPNLQTDGGTDFSSLPLSVTTNARVFEIDFGDITNTDTNNATTETITITYTAAVRNTAASNNGQTRNNNANWNWDGDPVGVSDAAPNITIVEPELVIDKVADIDAGQSGSVVNYTVSIENTTNVPAYDVIFEDTIPTGMQYIASSFGSSSTFTVTEDVSLLPSISADLDQINANETITISYSAEVLPSVAPGQELINNAGVSWTSLAGDQTTSSSSFIGLSSERTGDTGQPGGASNDYTSDSSHTFTVDDIIPIKEIIDTSESNTVGTNVTIGEIIRYKLIMNVPESTSVDFEVVDQLPDGLQFLDDGTATIALISNTGGVTNMTSTTLPVGAQVVGSSTNFDPSFVIPTANITVTGSGSGDDVIFNFGDLTNADDDADEEYVVIAFNAIVNNQPSNQAGTNLENSFFNRIDGVDFPASADAVVSVQEAGATFSKVITQAPDDAGDTIEYTLTVTATGVISTYNHLITDNLNANVTLQSVVGTGVSYTDNSVIANNEVSLLIPQLDPGQQLVITITAMVNPDVAPGQELSNQADHTFESLSPDTYSNTNPTGSVVPGQPGASDGSRNGDDGVNGANNDFANEGQADILLNTPTITKFDAAESEYAIGEEIEYDILVDLPEGEIDNIIIRDQIPDGFAYVSEQAIVLAANSNGRLAADYAGDVITLNGVGGVNPGDDIDYTLGNITTTDDNDATNNSFIVRITVRVANIASVEAGDTFANVAELLWDDPNTGSQLSATDDSTPITVIEPELDITKTVDDENPSFNQELEYTITVSHTSGSTADAFGVNLNDLVPAGLDYVVGSLQADNGWTVDETAAPTLTLNGDLALGQTTTITYRAETQLPSTLTTGQGIINTVDGTWSSLPGSVPGERDGAGGINDYADTVSEEITISAYDLTVDKADAVTSTSDSEVLMYSLTIENIGNATVNNAIITETVPNNTVFNAAQSSPGWSCVDASPAGTTCALDIGSLNSLSSQSRFFSVTTDASFPAGVDEITNQVTVAGGPLDGLDADPNNNDADDVNSLDATPDISVTIDDGETAVVPGQTITYTVTVENNGTQDATGVITTADIPDFATYVSNTGSGTENAGVVTWPATDLAVGESITYTYTVTIDPNIPTSVTTIDAETSANDDGANGADPTPANNSDTDQDILNAAPDLFVTKVGDVTTLTTGGAIQYTINYGNIGNQTAENVTISEIVPIGTTFTAASSDVNWSCADGAIAGTICTFDAGTVLGSGTGSVLFAVTVADPLASGIEEVENFVTIADDGANGNDPDTTNNQFDTQTPITATPDIRVTKTNSITEAQPGQTVNYIITVENVGDQNATNITLEDTIPANTSFVNSTDAGVFNAGQVQWPLFDLASGASVSRVITIAVDGVIPAGVEQITNQVSAQDDGTNGSDPTPLDNTATHTDTLVAAPDMTVTKTDGGATLIPGDVLLYTLNFDNLGNQDATGVVITESVPAHSQFNAAQSTTGWSCADGSLPGTTCEFTVGNQATSDPQSITFAVTVDTPLPSAVEELSNNVSIADDGTNGPDSNPANNDDQEVTTINGEPDLLITIDDGGITTQPGDVVDYTINYENTGNQDATGVVITQIVPAGGTFDATNSDPNWSCVDGAVAGTICTLLVGDLDSGETGTITFSVLVDTPLDAGIDDLELPISISDDGASTANPVTDTDFDNTPIIAAPNLSISKTDAVDAVISGQTLTYTLTVSNQGDQNATGVAIVDVLPTELLYVSSSDSGSFDGTQVTWPLIDLIVGETITRTITATVDIPVPTPAGLEAITNNATVADDGTNGPDGDETDNQAEDTDTVTGDPDLTITKTDNIEVIEPNQVITYELTVENVGVQIASNAIITETVPTGTVFNPANSSAGWICDMGGVSGSTCTFTIPMVDPSEAPVIVDFAVLTDSILFIDSIANFVQIADDGTSGADPTPENNTASENTPVIGNPDLQITKTNGVTEVEAGETITYTLEVTNLGNVPSSGIEVLDNLSIYSTFQSADNGGTYDMTSNQVTWTGIGLNPNQSTSVSVTVEVSDAIPAGVEEIENTASVSDDGTHGVDQDPDNNSATDTDILNAAPELMIVEIANPDAFPGQDMEYVYEYSNIGNQDVTGVVITAVVPEFTTVSQEALDAGWSCPNGTTAGSVCTYNVGDMAVGETGQIPFTVTVVDNDMLDQADPQIINEVSIADDGSNGAEATLQNNIFLVQTTIRFADLEIEKTVQSSEAQIRDVLIYDFVFRNNGISDATGVVMTDILPAELIFTSASRDGQAVQVDQDGQMLTIQIGNIAAGEEGSVQITTEVDQNVDRTITNEVSIRANEADPEISNNTSTVDVELSKLPLPVLLRTGGNPGYIAILIGMIILIGVGATSFRYSKE